MAIIGLVSIITPAYNASSSLEETFESIKKQTYSNWEWIIVDDCSSDSTYELCFKYASLDNRVRLFKTNKGGSAAIARNLGIENANGQYIAFLDADDTWEPNKLSDQISFMKNKKCSFSYGPYYVLHKNGNKKLFNPKNDFTNYKRLLKTNDIGCLTVMYDVIELGKVYMPTDCPKREDYATWLDITKKGIKAYKVPSVLGTYTLSNTGVSANKAKMIKYQWIVYRKHEQINFFKSLLLIFVQIFNKVFRKY